MAGIFTAARDTSTPLLLQTLCQLLRAALIGALAARRRGVAGWNPDGGLRSVGWVQVGVAWLQCGVYGGLMMRRGLLRPRELLGGGALQMVLALPTILSAAALLLIRTGAMTAARTALNARAARLGAAGAAAAKVAGQAAQWVSHPVDALATVRSILMVAALGE
eukprot:SAG11_NODE_3217_length_2604_cov_1.697006_2_plen_164_part_00